MIFQENEFLKTYNEINKLWEDAEGTPGYTFVDIINRVAEVSEKDTLSDSEAAYWSALRGHLIDKTLSHGRFANKSWCTRFITFYKAFLAEQAILNAINGNSSLNLVVSFDNTGGGHDAIYASRQDEKTKADFKINGNIAELFSQLDSAFNVAEDKQGVFKRRARKKLEQTINGGIECKTIDNTTSLHGARLVARHTPLQQGSYKITFYLAGRLESLCAVFKPILLREYLFGEKTEELVADDLLKEYKICAIARDSAADLSGERYIKVYQNTLVAEIDSSYSVDFERIEKQLELIDAKLLSSPLAKQDFATQVLDASSQTLTKSINTLAGESNKVKRSNSIEAAEGQLRDTLDQLVDTVKGL